MAKAVILWVSSCRVDPDNMEQIQAFITFRFLGPEAHFGPLDATATIIAGDTPASMTTKVQDAVIARAAEVNVVLTAPDLIPLAYGVPQYLISPTSLATLTATDDGTSQQFVGTLGALKFQAAVGPTLEITDVGFRSISIDFGGGTTIKTGFVAVYGTLDQFFQGQSGYADSWTVLENIQGAGTIIGTAGAANPISIRPNRVEVANFDANGLNMAAGTKLLNAAAQSGGKSVTNNVTAGGTADQGDDFTSLTLYASDAAAIRNNIYQLWQKLDRIADGLRTLGLLANS